MSLLKCIFIFFVIAEVSSLRVIPSENITPENALSIESGGFDYLSLQKNFQEVAVPMDDMRNMDGETLRKLTNSFLPEHFQGKNLVFLGDSNDRNIVNTFCAMHSAPIQILHEVFDGSGNKLFFPGEADHVPYMSVPRFCHIDGYDLSIMSLFHFGVNTIEPIPKWFNDTQFIASHYPTIVDQKGRKVLSRISSDVLIRDYYRSALAHLPPRPINFVVQSSVWDSLTAASFLAASGRQLVLDQNNDALTMTHDWPSSHELLGDADKWQWMQHATKLIESIQATDFGQKVEHIFWRTMPDCPINDKFVSAFSEKQASAVRASIIHSKGPWKAVYLLDWRAKCPISSQDQCHAGIHFKDAIYACFLDLLSDKFRDIRQNSST